MLEHLCGHCVEKSLSISISLQVRRLSPVGLAANGFIDILNGPQDNGWCGGYTCQERISTFFGIVATGLSYTMALTSTNPQNTALHMLNANEDQAIVIAVFYTNPQRLDVYYNGQYVVPNNAMMLENGNLEYQEGAPSEFVPSLDQPHGSNYYDRDAKKLYIHMRGKSPYEIRTAPVIQVWGNTWLYLVCVCVCLCRHCMYMYVHIHTVSPYTMHI